MKYNVTLKDEHGSLKLEDCKKLPTIEEIEQQQEDLEYIGLGELKQIVIDILNK